MKLFRENERGGENVIVVFDECEINVFQLFRRFISVMYNILVCTACICLL